MYEKEDKEPRRRMPNEEGVGRMRNIGDPRLPTQREVDEHKVTHVP